MEDYKKTIEQFWLEKDFSSQHLKNTMENIVKFLELGKLRVAEKINGVWHVNDWVQKAVSIYLHISANKIIKNAPCGSNWFDKIDQKFTIWEEEDFIKNKIRAVPGCFVRKSSYIGSNVVLMPSFINVGAFIDDGTMIDTWATIGSCAQIGKNCHISGGVGIGGVLEPISKSPVIVEDNCFIGARSEIVEGVKIGEGSVIGMGCYIGSSTKIVDRVTGEINYGSVPPYSVVVAGSLKYNSQLSTYCVMIIKKVDQETRKKIQINDLLRF